MKKFLILAQDYALAHGDDDWFCEVYGNYRQTMDIHDSTWMTLSYLYGGTTANMLQEQAVPTFV